MVEHLQIAAQCNKVDSDIHLESVSASGRDIAIKPLGCQGARLPGGDKVSCLSIIRGCGPTEGNLRSEL